jgi:hypothetical protein
MSFIKTFDQVTKHTFDQTPVLLETFDQVIRSSEIRSSDPLSVYLVHLHTGTFRSQQVMELRILKPIFQVKNLS